MRRKPEVMSPAGYWPQLEAAVEAGADAVYFGLHHFTARAKVGFSLEELPEVMRRLHRRGVRGFVTFNTLVFEDELRAACSAIASIASAGADALIVQDVGALGLAREIAPDLELHASTQMSITDARGARLAQRMGAHRVTLARELSLTEIAAIAAETDVELEVFVHGALCVAYSGQCFSSEAWGGRSANRGQCAQACRMPYELIVDGVAHPTGEARYLLSPGDLYALEQVPELTEIGVATLKIEGRYKEAEYVAAATRAYREAVDAAWAGASFSVDPRVRLELEQVYSRGLGAHFISGTNHQTVVEGRVPRHRGVLLGTVRRVDSETVTVEPSSAHALSPLKAGDGVVFDASAWRSPQEREEGGRVYEVRPVRGGLLEIAFGNGVIDFRRVRPGDLLWRTDDPALDKALKRYTAAPAPVRKQPVEVGVVAREGERLRSTWRVGSVSATVESPEACPPAQGRVFEAAVARAQFERLGDTVYELGRLEVEIVGRPFVPVSVLNALRREAVMELERLQGALPSPVVRAVEPLVPVAVAPDDSVAPVLHLLVRAPEQLDAALAATPASITLDYLDLYGLKPSVERVRAAGIGVRVATPRILKPGEEKIADFLRRLECPLLVRPAGLLEALDGGVELTGDFSLNAANPLSAEKLLGLGLARLTPTHDLNAAQIGALARAVGGGRLEVIAYHHLPVFHTEHCVFCRFLSTGVDFRDCGRPCEKHRVELGDASGRSHPVVADIGCRNTVFGAEAQEGSAFLGEWLEAGIRHFRLEFVHESGAQVAAVTRAWRSALEGEISARELGERLRRAAPQGVTAGSFFVPVESLGVPAL